MNENEGEFAEDVRSSNTARSDVMTSSHIARATRRIDMRVCHYVASRLDKALNVALVNDRH